MHDWSEAIYPREPQRRDPNHKHAFSFALASASFGRKHVKVKSTDIQSHLFLVPLAVRLGGVVAASHDQILGLVVVAAGEVAVQDALDTSGVALLRIDRGTGHVGYHGVSASPCVLSVAEGMVLGCGLREPDITAVAAELAGLEGLGDVLLDDDGTTGGVNEPRACEKRDLLAIDCIGTYLGRLHTLLHLGEKVLVEQSTGLLVQRAVDGHNIALSKHLLEILNASAADLLLLLGAQWLVVEVEQLLAVEWLQSPEHTLANTANSDGTDDLVFEVVLVLCDCRNIPFARGDLLVCGHKVANQSEDGHDDVLSHRDDIAASDFSDGDTTVRLVGRIEIHVIGTDTSSDGNLEVLGLGETLRGQVTRVEALDAQFESALAL